MYHLGLCYEFGRGDCIKDLEKAYSLYENAANIGNEDAKLKLEESQENFDS